MAPKPDRGSLPLLLPAGVVFLGLFFLPMAGLFVESLRFYQPGSIGSSANAPFTIANYAELATRSFAGFFLETLRISVLASLAGLVFAFPLAYWITRRLSPRWRAIAVGLFVTLMFLSVLVRTYALELTSARSARCARCCSPSASRPMAGAISRFSSAAACSTTSCRWRR